MKRSAYNLVKTGSSPVRLGVALGLLLTFVLVVAGPASAAYEQVGTFGGSLVEPIPPEGLPESDQLVGVDAMAVNVDGAGGVPPGTVYAIGFSEPSQAYWRVSRFSPSGEFREAWGPHETERCGPEVPPIPPSTHYPICKSPQIKNDGGGLGIDVDQATGNVYVYSENESKSASKDVVYVYSPDGSKLISRFAEGAATGETTAASSEKFHGGSGTGGIAVDDTGNVYLFDLNPADHFRYRLMVFRPQTPGDYSHYVYAGEGDDIGPGSIPPGGHGRYPSEPVLDSHGHVFVAQADHIDEFDPSKPTTAICEFEVVDQSLISMTVNPESGEVFYYDSKDKLVHQLHACNAEGKFVEVEGGAFKISPNNGSLGVTAMTFNPGLEYEPGREAGVLYAGNPGAGQNGLGYIIAPPAKHEPVVESESVSKVLSSSASLSAEVNPKGANTRYHFQYITAMTYEANEPSERFAGSIEAPVNGVSLGGGSVGIAAGVTVSGLSPDTEYYYRVVAVSGEGTAAGAAMSFHTFPAGSLGLPDGRAYELVSPIDKNGGEVFSIDPEVGSCIECKGGIVVEHFPVLSAPDGEAVAYEGSSFTSEGAVKENAYVSRRTASGWQTTDLSPSPASNGSEQGFKAFDTELTRALMYQGSPVLAPQAPADYANLYEEPTSGPLAPSPLLSEAPPNRSPGPSLKFTYAGASADLSRIFFEANDALTGETPFAPAAVDGGEHENNLYEWSGGALRLVNVAPGNTTTSPGGGFGQPHVEAPVGNYINELSNAVSGDGSRVFWSSEAGQVYVRENGERTVEVPDHTGRFLTAAADGSKVLLTDGHIYGQLEGEPPVQEADLTDGKGGFLGIVGQSEDLSHIYFVDTAVLDETPGAEGTKAQTGDDNLYEWHEGGNVFIVTLSQTDSGNGGQENDWVSLPIMRTAQASPDGRWVAFESKARLTGYDNTGPCDSAANSKSENETLIVPCFEAFVYDSATGTLTCASCDPSGALPLGASYLPTHPGVGSLSQPRYLTDSGRLLFDSGDSLSPLDTNHGVEDVYEYEPAGVGSCAREGGCVSLISGGTGSSDSNFLAMDPSGRNVFFTTSDQLTGRDHDQQVDVYDAREGGGIAAESEPSPQGCGGEACQQQSPSVTSSSSSVGPAPGSLTFSGPGNTIEPSPITPVAAKPKAKTLSRAQQRARALQACHRKKHKSERVSCEKRVRKQYAVKAGARKTVVNDRKGSK